MHRTASSASTVAPAPRLRVLPCRLQVLISLQSVYVVQFPEDFRRFLSFFEALQIYPLLGLGGTNPARTPFCPPPQLWRPQQWCSPLTFMIRGSSQGVAILRAPTRYAQSSYPFLTPSHLSGVPLECIGLRHFFSRLAVSALLPILLLGIIFAIKVAAPLAYWRRHTADPSASSANYVLGHASFYGERPTSVTPSAASVGLARTLTLGALPLCLHVVVFTFPGVTSLAFRTFSCRCFGDECLLEADYSVTCSRHLLDGAWVQTEEYTNLVTLASCTIALYRNSRCSNPTQPNPSRQATASRARHPLLSIAVGVPLLFGVLLWMVRHDFSTGRASPLKRAATLLHGNLRPSCYYWELVHTLFKIFIVGFAVLIAPGSLVQVVVALLVATAYLVLVLYTQPYEQGGNNFCALCASVCVVNALLCCLLLKIGVLVEESRSLGVLSILSLSKLHFPAATISGLLFFSTLAVLLAAALLLVQSMRASRALPIARTARGDPIKLRELQSGLTWRESQRYSYLPPTDADCHPPTSPGLDPMCCGRYLPLAHLALRARPNAGDQAAPQGARTDDPLLPRRGRPERHLDSARVHLRVRIGPLLPLRGILCAECVAICGPAWSCVAKLLA